MLCMMMLCIILSFILLCMRLLPVLAHGCGKVCDLTVPVEPPSLLRIAVTDTVNSLPDGDVSIVAVWHRRVSRRESVTPIMFGHSIGETVRDFIEMFGSEGSFIFSELNCSSDVKPVFHIQSASKIIADNAHFPSAPNASVTYASEIIYSRQFMLEGMIKTIANDVSVTIVFADSETLATYLVTEASKLDHAPYLSGSGKLMDLMMQRTEGV
ncbi:hypothetical protein EV702DRAFT_1046546 [Suillus placidus]|uniref:Uncharacterized protein n=1 Tax=Suillus placidus TaxID=48579 RepID=A0A9P7D2C1_9AGAM|nr:hypothetical protein EV702DRAFT_1046546 [Suillus placidus]